MGFYRTNTRHRHDCSLQFVTEISAGDFGVVEEEATASCLLNPQANLSWCVCFVGATSAS
jgi:hypothetical protein